MVIVSLSVNLNPVLISKLRMMQARNVGILIATARHMVDVVILVTSVIPRLKDTRMKQFLTIK